MKKLINLSNKSLSTVMMMWAILMLTMVSTVKSQTLTASISSHSNVSCYGACNGTATASASGGTPSYTYIWSTTPSQTTITATGICAGTYTVTVSDAVANSATASVTITQPTALLVNCSLIANVTCHGGCNGVISASSSGGTPSYTYMWNTTPVQVTQTATGVCAGTYTVTVTDMNGCTGTCSATITQPTLLISSITVNDSILCNGQCNGSVSAIETGGTPPFNYHWSNGETSPSMSGLCAATYTVTITDGNGCTASASVTLTQPPPLNAYVTGDTNIVCYEW